MTCQRSLSEQSDFIGGYCEHMTNSQNDSRVPFMLRDNNTSTILLYVAFNGLIEEASMNNNFITNSFDNKKNH